MRVVQVVRSSWLRVRATRDTTVYHSPAWQRKRSVGKRQTRRKLLRKRERQLKRRCRGNGAKEAE